MPSLLTYAYMAQASYGDDQADMRKRFEPCPDHSKWKITWWQCGCNANGFQGTVFASDDEVVCAYKGSKGNPLKINTGTGFDDWLVNDRQVVMGKVPKQVTAATWFLKSAEYSARDGKKLSIVGHSLGGALAQYVGYMTGTRFITFNAPGMKRNVPKADRGNVASGFNMILSTDAVGNCGAHIGKTERFLAAGALNLFSGGGAFAHQMGCVLATLKLARNSRWAAKELDALLA